ncbi:hypothetical protein [Paenibacillus agaridevorans]|uniref:hypothetical protein n=1 Tax=Paenibacillus agaridevorans TaxID=171404 RepID=UPI001BE41211|nr:hypothetical protein [Paenibacillus agaridevorans]
MKIHTQWSWNPGFEADEYEKTYSMKLEAILSVSKKILADRENLRMSSLYGV